MLLKSWWFWPRSLLILFFKLANIETADRHSLSLAQSVYFFSSQVSADRAPYFWAGGRLSGDKRTLTWENGRGEGIARGRHPWSFTGSRGQQPDGRGSEHCLAVLNNFYNVSLSPFFSDKIYRLWPNQWSWQSVTQVGRGGWWIGEIMTLKIASTVKSFWGSVLRTFMIFPIYFPTDDLANFTHQQSKYYLSFKSPLFIHAKHNWRDQWPFSSVLVWCCLVILLSW